MRKKAKRAALIYFGLVIFLFVLALVVFGDKSNVPTLADYQISTAGPTGEYTWGWSNDEGLGSR